MKFTIAVAAFAAGASATYPVAANTTAYTTEVVTSYETYCPGPTQITYGTNTYTVTEATTLTITDCPCTISKPVYTTSLPATSAVSTPVYPTSVATIPAPPVYPNSTAAVPTTSSPVYPTGGAPGTTTSATVIPTAGAGKVAALSGAGLAGLLGLAVAAL